MTQPDGSVGRRVPYLESIRGLASLQVLFLHAVTAFMPGLVRSTWQTGTWAGAILASPLFFLYDGYSAVYVFFVLSGVVLTFAFEPRLDHPAALLCGRLVRLVIPAVAACLVAAGVRAVVGTPNVAAGLLINNHWLADHWQPVPGLWFFLKDSLLNATVLGYLGTGTLGLVGLANLLDADRLAYVVPLWTLSIEVQGSVLVLVLAMLRRQSALAWYLGMVLATIILGRTHFLGFIAGHLVAVALRTDRLPRLNLVMATILLILGIFLCVVEEIWTMPMIVRACDLNVTLVLPCTPHPQKVLGALCLFIGLIGAQRIRSVFGNRVLVEIGRLSFAIYLIHWPIIFGLVAWLFLVMVPTVGLTTARIVCVILSIGITVICAPWFAHADAWAIALGRRTRDRVLRRPA